MKKKGLLIIFILVLLIISIIVCSLIIFHQKERITFYIDGKEAVKLNQEVEYSDSIDYSTKAIKLTAKKNGKNITDKIKFNKITIRKLKTYKITYQVEDTKFIYHMKVVDKSAPVITGETSYTIKQNETFDQTKLNLVAKDNFDHDLSDQITTDDRVDTTTPGEYILNFKVSDSSNNTSEFKCVVIVEATLDNTYNQYQDSGNTSNNATGNTGSSIVSNPNDITVLINKQYRLPDGYAPNDLVSIGGNHYLRAEAANSLNSMRQAAMNSGIQFNVVSSYRSQAYQTTLYNNYYMVDPVNAPFYSAYPRTSEHELGLAIDISYDYALHDDLQNSALGQWMAAHAHEYGWIMRYPYGKSNVTGYIYEAWHYRYVGVPLAAQLKNSGLVLEEVY